MKLNYSRHGRAVALGAVFGALFLSSSWISAAAQSLSVREELADFFRAYLGRALSAGERDAVVTEYQAFFGDDGRCNEACRDALARLRDSRLIFAQFPGSPQDPLLRHAYISNAVFDPRNQGGLILDLLTEPDPVAVVDPVKRRIMTHKDVAALAHLQTLAKTKSPPPPRKIAPGALEEAARQLAGIFGAQAGRPLPFIFTIAAELQAGVAQNWRTLSESERAEIFAYLEKGSQDPMSPALYAKLLDIPLASAREFADLEALEGYRARMNARINAYLGVTSDALLLQSIFNSGALEELDE